MELVPLVCLFVATWGGITSADGSTVITQVEKEDGVAVLHCSLGKNTQGKVFSWWKDGGEKEEVFTFRSPNDKEEGRFFKGRVSHFPEALQSGNTSIVIRGAKVSDSGNYICEIPNDPPETRAIISLTVGAAPKPVVAILRRTESGVLLQCEVLGAFPKPHVEWQDSAGTTIQAEEHVTDKSGKYDTVLNITVTKSDNFRCISTQETIHHQISAQTFVPFAIAARSSR